jgi:hypothetical protein
MRVREALRRCPGTKPDSEENFMPKYHQGRLASLMLTAALACLASVPGFAADREGRISTAADKVKHVFVIVLENKTFSVTFGTSTQDPYLQKTLVPKGALLTQYYGTGHVSLDNYISMISGQSPTRVILPMTVCPA